MIDKKAVPTKLLWVDLEMTGLDPENDVILEVAAEITDFNFKTLGSYEAIVRQPVELVVDRMGKNSWWQDYPTNRDEFVRKMEQGKLPRQVELELITFVEKQFGSETAVLAGNSIHSDRKFIARYWPQLDLKLHYRMLDVSALMIFKPQLLNSNFT
jgi:oligoribonuclease